ncbi:hypothetical protein KTH81_22445 [Lachnospiraceae bacterium ASD3451]|uniref:hypothetical protein n=1 Tax=Diplocloster agilis TaxID=2850323 RepID=UPI001E19D3CD|nr:hypothetical protein [Diplocloster agilis]MBU9746585.1 hypothetical protein [Diplocloster agilis]
MGNENDEIIFGAADVYMYEFTGNTIPENATIETNDHLVGHTSGGASVEYKPTKYDVENSYGKVVRSYVTKEEITAKTGLLSWKLERLALLSTARFTTSRENKLRVLEFKGGSNLSNVLIRFVHTKENGKKLRFTMIGQGGNGFTIPFETKEATVDAEIMAIEYIKGFLAKFEEELTDEEAAAITGGVA